MGLVFWLAVWRTLERSERKVNESSGGHRGGRVHESDHFTPETVIREFAQVNLDMV